MPYRRDDIGTKKLDEVGDKKWQNHRKKTPLEPRFGKEPMYSSKYIYII